MRLPDACGEAKGASLLVLPEALPARDDGDPDLSVKSAQTLEGVSETTAGRKRWQHAHHHIDGPYSVLAGRAVNTLVAIREGAIVASYAKLHLYDAFSVQESRPVDPGSVIPPLIEVEGFKALA